MLLMSKYKGQHGGKRVNKFGQAPPPFQAMAERKVFSYKRCSLNQSPSLRLDPNLPLAHLIMIIISYF